MIQSDDIAYFVLPVAYGISVGRRAREAELLKEELLKAKTAERMAKSTLMDLSRSNTNTASYQTVKL